MLLVPLRNRRLKRAFTLLETLVVLTLMTLLALASLAILKLPVRRAERELQLTQLRTLERDARRLARSGTPCFLQWDVPQNCVRLCDSDKRSLQTVELRRPLRIQRIELPAEGPRARVVEIEIGAGGTSQSYAVELLETNTTGCWFICCGLTGELYEFNQTQGALLIRAMATQSGRHAP